MPSHIKIKGVGLAQQLNLSSCNHPVRMAETYDPVRHPRKLGTLGLRSSLAIGMNSGASFFQ